MEEIVSGQAPNSKRDSLPVGGGIGDSDGPERFRGHPETSRAAPNVPPEGRGLSVPKAFGIGAFGGGDGDGAAGQASDGPRVYDEAYVKGLRSEAAATRVKLRELEAAETARRTAEETAKLAELSEVERLKVQLAETERRAKTLEVHSVRTAAAARHGLPDDLIEFITAEEEAGALAQAEKLASRMSRPKPEDSGPRSELSGAKPASGLPQAGGRNPANGGEQAARLGDQERFDAMRRAVPALNNRVLRS